MIAARTIGGPVYTEMIEETDRELIEVIDDFDRVMSFKAPHLVNETSKPSFSQSVKTEPQGFGVERAERERERMVRERAERAERELLFRRLKPVSTSYHRKLCCMDGTRQSLLNQVLDWVANKSGQDNVLQGSVYWVYGSPGIGKTSLAHSICATLHDRNHLAGAFFCRRDDPDLSEPRN